ncbi:MAG TPA: hypothetical protein VMW76_06015 [Bacteroidales bacterium]|nr:hypothetical protein [Bacteroidales bacterium]
MKFTKAISLGLTRTIRSAKSILIIWLITFLGFALFAIPLKGSIFQALGNSYGTELIRDGFNIDFWADLASVASFLPMISRGGLFLLFLFFIIYIFLNGGLFDSLRSNSCSYRISSFFGSSAKLFGSYLVATLLVVLMIIFAAGLIIGVPVLISRVGGSSDIDTMQAIYKITRIIFLFASLIFLLVIDYTRAWLAANDHKRVFKALGYGFKATFTSFFGSYIFMLLITAIQILYVWIVTRLLSGMQPSAPGGLFLLFILAQVLFFLKLVLRAWRYGGVTTLYET